MNKYSSSRIMVNTNNRTQALTAGSATVIFITFFIAQLLCMALLEAVGGVSLRPLEEFLITIIGCVVMVSMAFRLAPEEIRKNDPTSAAWTLGNWENLVKGLGIGCAIGAGSYFWDLMSASHSSSHSLQRYPVEPIYQRIVTPGAQQILAIVLLVLLGPAFEEMMFRGILY
ncbi:MAG TPA: hypothetical protein VMO20_07575, partial [Candidatus Acidoferrum sp.]|nr:hypothetical protein [Candidatus Acidoferrum sp.]